MNDDVSGYLLLKKNPGITSFEALYGVKRALGTRRVGHTGTLDKFAGGLLVVLAGRAAKLNQWFSASDKSYDALVAFGAETDTLDPEGETIAEAPPPSAERLSSVLPSFTGEIMQAPPSYSAVHIDGRRAHERVRSGEDVEMRKRPVYIHSLELLSYEAPLARLRVRCSKGTYIRSLARDIALAAGSRAHLEELTRTGIAGFSLENAVDPALAGEEGIRRALRPIDTAAFEALGLPFFEVDDGSARSMVLGKPIAEQSLGPLHNGEASGNAGTVLEGAFVAGVFRRDGSFTAMIEKKEKHWKYGFVYART